MDWEPAPDLANAGSTWAHTDQLDFSKKKKAINSISDSQFRFGVPLVRVNWPIIMSEHFGISFSILLHFESFKILQERLLKLYKSSLKYKSKGPARKEP